jgi:hypothetical protein
MNLIYYLFQFFQKENFLNGTVSLLLSDDDNLQISAALSFIWTKLQYRLKTISINDHTAVIKYGKHIDRLMVDLKDNSSYYEDLEVKLLK